MEKLRAVIYNRCSTEEESQKDALVKQVQESRRCVSEQGWQLVDTYVEAKSGTTVKGRNEYNRLYQDLESNKFDIIVIKSQDRLMRNTRDWYLFLDRMQKNRKRLYMYLERKFYTPDDALITGIKAILAEEYSRELSKKINNAHRNRQREGKSFVLTNQTYGYRRMPDKSIVIDQKEAEMIRMVFQLSASGYGTHCSAEILYRHGYRNHKGKRLGPSLIRNIIRNPIYKGTVVQNRQHYDFESKQVFKNPPSEWLFHENAVPRIVDEELFEKANRGLDHRRQGKRREDIPVKKSGREKYGLSGRLICGLCGSPFYRTVRQNKSGKVIEWKCSNYLQNGRKEPQMRRDLIRKTEKQQLTLEKWDGCDNVHLDEKKIYIMLEQLYSRKYQEKEGEKDALQKATLAILRKALGTDNALQEKRELEILLDKVVRQKNILLEKLLGGVVSDTDFRIKNEELEFRRSEIKKKLQLMEKAPPQNAELEDRILSIRKNLEEGVIRQAQAAAMISLIRKIEVFPACMEIYLDAEAAGEIPAENAFPVIKDETDQLIVIRMAQTCTTSHRPVIEEEKKTIMSLMRQNPEITAKELSQRMGMNLSLVHRRIRELKEEGKIRYSSGGRGKWQILTALPDHSSSLSFPPTI